MAGRYKVKSKSMGWAAFWLLIPILVLVNHFGGFVQLGFGSIITGAIAVAILIYCIATLSFATLPIPIATLYLVLQVPLELPFIPFWTLVLVAVPLTIALHVLLPTPGVKHGKNVTFGYHEDRRPENEKVYNADGEVVFVEDDEDDEDDEWEGRETVINENDDENNPYISVQFGGVSRYLHSDNLETLELSCNFGGMDIYMDQVQLSPNGATAHVDCKFGGVDIYVPAHWRVVDQIRASIGSSDVDERLQSADPNAPTLTLKGNVSFGAVDVTRIKTRR